MKIGKATFQLSGQAFVHQNSLVPIPIVHYLQDNSDEWIISNSGSIIVDQDSYRVRNWKLAFAKMKSAQIRTLTLWGTLQAQIIKQVCHVNFSQLKKLYLGKNKISSIESLTFVQTPRLVSIFLSQNEITCIKSVAKMSAQKLQQISIDDNPVNQIQCLAKFHGNTVKINLEHSSSHLTQTIGNDLSVLIKVQTKYMKSIYAKNYKRIGQKKIDEIMINKYRHLKCRRLM